MPLNLTVRSLLVAVLVLAWAPALADQRCELSFESGRFDACQQRGIDMAAAGLLPAGQTRVGDHAYWVVKFDAPIDAGQRQQLAALDARILDYLPWHAYRIRLPAAADPHGALDGLVWAGAMAPEWKLAGGLAQLLAGDPADRPAAVPLSIGLVPDADALALLTQWRRIDGVAHGFTVTGVRNDRVVLSIEGSTLEAVVTTIAPSAEVTSITVRKRMEFLNSRGSWLHQGGVPDERPIFGQGLVGCGQIVGFLDSGQDFSHCAFEDTELGDPPISECTDGDACPPGTADFLQRKTVQYYKWSSASDALGDAVCSATGGGHGTHVAASIAGNDWADPADCEAGLPGGHTDLDGMAPGAQLIAQEMGEDLAYVNSLGGSIYHAASVAYAQGARIHSNSWGGSCCLLGIVCLAPLLCTPSYDEFAADADQATWDFPDLLITVAAGNNGTCCASVGGAVGTPGLAKSALTVGASGAGGAGENAASFSSRGPVFDRRTKPDVMAQGDGIISAASDGDAGSSSCGTCAMSGTSMATPTAAGLAALVREYLDKGYYPSGSASAGDQIAAPSAALVKALLINGARDMTGTGADAAVPNQVEGWGRIHLDDVLHFAGDERRLWLHDSADGVVTGDAHEHAIQAEDGQPLKVTLVWSDHPAAVGSNPNIVNQLRLELETPDGAVWSQKLPAAGTPDPFQDTGDTDHDGVNTVHQILLAEPEAGTYVVRVLGINVAMGKPGQPYAVVATGALAADGKPPLDVDLALDKTADTDVVDAGAGFTYTLTVTSDADGAEAVVLTDELPAGLCVTAIDAPGWDCALVDDVLTCSAPDPLLGQPEPVVLSVLAPDTEGELVNSAQVGSQTPDPDDDNNHASVTVNVVDPNADRIFADGFEPTPEQPACL